MRQSLGCDCAVRCGAPLACASSIATSARFSTRAAHTVPTWGGVSHPPFLPPSLLRLPLPLPALYPCLPVLQTTLAGELRQLGAAISQDIFQESPNVKWGDIAGLADAKR